MSRTIRVQVKGRQHNVAGKQFRCNRCVESAEQARKDGLADYYGAKYDLPVKGVPHGWARAA